MDSSETSISCTKNNFLSSTNYIQMSNLSSGAGVNTTNNSSSFLNNNSSHRSSFRVVQKPSSFNPLPSEEVGFIDENADDQSQDQQQQQQIVYNSPWDFKIKLQLNQSSNSISRLSIVQPSPAPRIIPPAVPTSQPPSISQSVKTITSSGSQSSLTSSTTAVPTDQDESQYCAPWDLKIQEELLKKMAESSSSTSTSTKTNTLNNGTNSLQKDNMSSLNNNNNSTSSSGSFRRDNPANQSIKSTKSINELLFNSNNSNQSVSNHINSNRNTNVVDNSESNEYNPPWELKQSILMQSLTSNAKQPNQSTQQLVNNRAQLTNRSNTSSSSSTSSLSTNSPPSMPPPLPPSVPPPPLPTSTLNQETKRCFHHQTSQQQLVQTSQQVPQPSPSLSHKHLSRNFTTGFLPTSSTLNSNNSSIFLPIANTTVSNSNPVTNTSVNTSNVLMANSNYLNDKPNIICAWNTNSFDPNTANRFVTNTSNSHLIHLQQTHNHAHHHHHHHPNCQTVSTVNNVDACVQAVPLTALVAFPSNSTTSTSSLAANLMTLNIQQQAQGALVLPQLPSPSHQSTLERQIWFHGRITRKHAEEILNNRPVGSYLVRQSESGNSNDYSLSLVSGSGAVHMRICLKNGEFILGQCSQPFSSIVKMIEHYGKVEVPIKGAQHVRLLVPIPNC